MKIRIKFANTEHVLIDGFAMSYRKYAALLDYRDELRQHAQWHN
jgi:hypothetical protein